MLTIYMRKDLNMRKGKMVAQSSHAAMKLFLEAMTVENSKLILKNNNKKFIQEFFKNPEVCIKQVNSEEELVSSFNQTIPYSEIVDHGRTEFKGVLTKTCGAQGIFNEPNSHKLYVPVNYEEGIKAKQIFVFSKQNPLNKEIACKMAVIGCLKLLFKQMELNDQNFEIDLNKENPLSDWIKGAFAKIALSTKNDDDLDHLMEQLKKEKIKFEVIKEGDNRGFVIEPLYYHQIDPLTGHLQLI